MACEAERSNRLKKEFEFLQKLDCPCEWWDEERVVNAHGSAAIMSQGFGSLRMHELIPSPMLVLLDVAVNSGSLIQAGMLTSG